MRYYNCSVLSQQDEKSNTSWGFQSEWLNGTNGVHLPKKAIIAHQNYSANAYMKEKLSSSLQG